MLTDFQKDKCLQDLNGSYLGLFLGNPVEGGAEVNKVSYSRQNVSFIKLTSGEWNNDSDISFGLATEDWGTITHLAFFDSATGGNMMFYGNLQLEKEIRVNEELKINKNFLIERLV